MRGLNGKHVAIEYTGELFRPILAGGLPTRVKVMIVDMPMIKLMPHHGKTSDSFWINVSQIAIIKELE